MLIATKDIAVIKRQRKVIDSTKLQRLAENLKSTKAVTGKALIHPITVRPRRDDDTYSDTKRPVTHPWVLVTGGRRIAAHVLLGWPEIDANDFTDLSPLEQKIVELNENIDREDLPWQDELDAKAEVLRIRKAQGMTQEQVADELGEDKGNFARDIKLHTEVKANPKLREAGTKNAARKASDHHKEIERRVNIIKQVDVADLKSKIFIADARDYVRTLADNSVDLHMWDPPWAMSYKSATEIAKKTSGSIVKGKYDDSPEANLDFLVDVIPHVVRTVKESGWIAIIFATTGMNWLKTHLMGACKTHGEYVEVRYNYETGEFYRAFEKCPEYAHRRILKEDCKFLDPEILPFIWYRPNSRNIGQWPDRHAKHVYESILVCNGGKARLVLTGKPDVLMYDNVYEDRLHEMQKPHALLTDLISRFTLPGELVVDLSFGSGSTLAAAADLGRDFRGCERNAELLSSALGLVAQYYKKSGKPTAAVAEHLPSAGRSKAVAASRTTSNRAGPLAQLEELGILSDDEAASIQ